MTTGEGKEQGGGYVPLPALGLAVGAVVRVDHGHNEPAQVHDETQHGPGGVLLARVAFGHTGSLERIPAAAPHEPTGSQNVVVYRGILGDAVVYRGLTESQARP